MRVLTLLAVLLTFAACDTNDPPGLSAAERAAYEAQIDAALVEVEAAIGRAEADDVSACRILPLGADACGEPTYFRAYSATDGDSTRIVALGAELTRLGVAYDAALGLVRECRVRALPTLVLHEGRCMFEAVAID